MEANVQRPIIFCLCVLTLTLQCSPDRVAPPISPTAGERVTSLARDAECRLEDGSQPTNHGKFSGDPNTTWLTEKTPDRKMCLTAEFTFTDPKNKIWRAPAKYQPDGASIPRALWTVVGSPFTGDYRRASIVHDKACDVAGNDKKLRRAADRMFYHATRAGGCTIKQATILYIGVRIGGWSRVVPRWQASVADEERGPDVAMTQSEGNVLSDYQAIAKHVLSQSETDDPAVIEARTDSAASAVVGRNMSEM